MAPNRGSASVAIVSVGYAFAVLSCVRLLALIRPVGTLLVVELIRAVLVGGGAALTAWFVLRTKAPDGRRVPLFNPGVGRCAGLGSLAGSILGGPAMAAASFREPTDYVSSGVGERATMLVFFGVPLGLVLGLLFGLLFAGTTSIAFRRTLRGAGDGFEGAALVASALVGGVGAASAFLHAMAAELDVLGIVMLLLAACGFGWVAKLALERAAWLGRVTLGRLPGWSIVPRDTPILLSAYADGGGEDGVLVFKAETEQGSFRITPQPPTPIALVDATGQRTLAILKSRALSCVVGAVLLGLVPVAVFRLYTVENGSAPSWSSTPLLVARGQTLTNLAATDGAMCARRATDGRLVCWGGRAGALLGKEHAASQTPEPDSRLGRIRSFAISAHRVCAVPEVGEHRASCWTEGDGELRPAGPPDIVELALGDSFTVAVTADGAVWRWGDDPARESKVTTPEPVPGLPAIAHVAASRYHVVALGRDGTAYCWGASTAGECGVNEAHVPVTRFRDGPFDAIAARLASSWLHEGGSWRTHGMVYDVGNSFFHGNKVRAYAFSGSDACRVDENGSVACTRGNKASPNEVLAWGALEIVGNEEGYCARTASDLWCWHGYSLLFSIFQ